MLLGVRKWEPAVGWEGNEMMSQVVAHSKGPCGVQAQYSKHMMHRHASFLAFGSCAPIVSNGPQGVAFVAFCACQRYIDSIEYKPIELAFVHVFSVCYRNVFLFFGDTSLAC